MPQFEQLLKSLFPGKTENMISSLVESAKSFALGTVDKGAVNVLQLMSKVFQNTSTRKNILFSPFVIVSIMFTVL